MANTSINLLALVKGQERYVFTFEDNEKSRNEIIQVLGRFASNKDLSFSWYDAAVLCQRIRKNDFQKAEVKVKPVNRIDPKS